MRDQTDDDDRSAATAYARDVVERRVVACRPVRQACERHLRDKRDGSDRGLRFDPELAEHMCSFFGLLRHSKGEWGGQRVELQPWQRFVVGSVFGWLRADGTRRFRTVYEELPRKQGKSLIVSGIGLIGLVADGEPGAEVYAAATRRDQARIIFGEAQRMVRSSPELRNSIGVYRNNLSVDRTASKFEPLSADERTLDGLNPHFVLVDELHKHKSRAVLDVLDTALGARRQPLLWIITTAGDDDPESVYAHENHYATQVLEGAVEDDSLFAFIATIDKEDRWDDPKAWAKANPNLGVSVKLDDLERQALKAKNSPSAQAAFKRLRLNVRTATADRYIDMDVWARNGLGPLDPADLIGRRCFGGLDLSTKTDLTAFVKLFPPDVPGDRWKVVPRFWMPADTVAEKADRDRVQYQRWIDSGLVEVTAGNIIDHNEVQQAIEEDARQFDVAGIAYDPWNATQMAVALQEKGVQMRQFVQGLRSYTAPTKELEAMLIAAKLDHGNNAVLTWMASNLAVTKPDKNDNRMPTKAHSRGRIDGMTALIMAIGLSLLDDGPSVYEDRGIITIG